MASEIAPPGPSAFALLRRLAATRGNLPVVMTELARSYGDVVRAKLPGSTFYLISHPDLIEEVLVTEEERFERVIGERRVSGRLVDSGLFTTEGKAHLDRREVMEAVMYHGAAEALALEVGQLAVVLADAKRDGETLDLFAWMEDLTTTLIIKILFGTGPDEQVGRDLAAAMTRTIVAMDAIAAGFSGLPEKLPRLKRRFNAARAELDRLIVDVIDERRADDSGNDVLSMLVRLGSRGRGYQLSDADLRNELVSLFRGHQAVSTALTWTFFQLAKLPDVEAAVQAEADAAGDGPFSFQDTPRLDYCRKVFAESLRLYPPAYVLARTSVADYTARGFTIPKGSRVLVSEWVTHRDPRFWDDPVEFDPERFTPEAEASRPNFAYFPQGGGKKMCMGRHFVRPMEGPILLATLARRWKMTLVAGKPVELSPKATLKPKNGVFVTLHRRQPEHSAR